MRMNTLGMLLIQMILPYSHVLNHVTSKLAMLKTLADIIEMNHVAYAPHVAWDTNVLVQEHDVKSVQILH